MTENSQQPNNPTEVYRLIIKNIPDKISNDNIMEVLKKNFENMIFDISINKLKHKYNSMKNKKICFLSTDSLNIRKKIIDFFLNFEFIDPKGLKHKFTIIDSLYQPATLKSQDKANNTIDTSELIIINFSH